MKTFEIEGRKFTFSFSNFSELFKNYRKRNELTVDKLEQELADKLYVQKSTIHSWKYGPSGPTDLQTIMNLSNCLELENYMYLLKEETIMSKLTDFQLQSTKRIYDALVSFLCEFESTGGFTTDMWYDLMAQGSKYPEEDIYQYVYKLEDKIHMVIRQEYFFLHDLPVYNELLNFAYEDLESIYDGKLGYAYRFEAGADGNPTTEEDYTKAMNKLNSIIEKYI